MYGSFSYALEHDMSIKFGTEDDFFDLMSIFVSAGCRIDYDKIEKGPMEPMKHGLADRMIVTFKPGAIVIPWLPQPRAQASNLEVLSDQLNQRDAAWNVQGVFKFDAEGEPDRHFEIDFRGNNLFVYTLCWRDCSPKTVRAREKESGYDTR